MGQFYEPVPGPPAEARQWVPGTDPEELAGWCGGWTYTGNQHGHTRPPWQEHTCLNLETDGTGGKGHADPGDWIVRVRAGTGGDDPDDPGTYLVLTADEFTARFRAAGPGSGPAP